MFFIYFCNFCMISYDFIIQQKLPTTIRFATLRRQSFWWDCASLLTVFCVGWVESWWEAKSVETGESHEDDSNHNLIIIYVKVKQLNNSSKRLKTALKGFKTVKFLWLLVHQLLLRRCNIGSQRGPLDEDRYRLPRGEVRQNSWKMQQW